MRQDGIKRILDNFKEDKITLNEAALYIEAAVINDISDEIKDRYNRFLSEKYMNKIKTANTLECFKDMKEEFKYLPNCASTALLWRLFREKAKQVLSIEDYEKITNYGTI
jgi:hypothetical protein